MRVKSVFSDDGALFAAITSAHEVRVFDVASGKCELIHIDDKESFSSMCFMAHESRKRREEIVLVLGCHSGALQKISMSSMTVSDHPVHAFQSAVVSLATNGRSLFAALAGSTEVSELIDFKPQPAVIRLSSVVKRLAADKTTLLVSGDDYCALIGKSREHFTTLKGFSKTPRSLVCGKDGLVVVCDGSETIKVYKEQQLIALLQSTAPVVSIVLNDQKVLGVLSGGGVAEWIIQVTTDQVQTVLPNQVDNSLAKKYNETYCLTSEAIAAVGRLPGELKFVKCFTENSEKLEIPENKKNEKNISPHATLAMDMEISSSNDPALLMEVENAVSITETANSLGDKSKVSLAPIIRQGLLAKDRKLLETVVTCSLQRTLNSTVKELTAAEVAGWLEYLVDSFERNPSKVAQVAEWVSVIMKLHSASILSQQRLRAKLEPLHAGLKVRLEAYTELQMLQGRLAAVAASCSASKAVKQPSLEPLIRWKEDL